MALQVMVITSMTLIAIDETSSRCEKMQRSQDRGLLAHDLPNLTNRFIHHGLILDLLDLLVGLNRQGATTCR